MFKQSQKIVYSATDLVNFLECSHITDLDRINLETPLPQAEEDDQSKLIRAKGFLHEAGYLRVLEASGLRIFRVEESQGSPNERARITLEAMSLGFDIIYQGAFTGSRRIGYADFLRRVDSPSKFGAYGYEVVDAKLARAEKAKFILQLCFYSDLLEQAQGVAPRMMHLVLGSGDLLHFRVANYSRYYRNVKARFLSHLSDDPRAGYPQKCSHCSLCRWRNLCQERWEKDDHLNQVAGITKTQIQTLAGLGVRTLKDLAGLPEESTLAPLESKTAAALILQARLQLAYRATGEKQIALLSPPAGKGFERLPRPDEGDLFFDMEGDPLVPGGHEYLFGVYFMENGKPIYRDFWAYEKNEERTAFEAFVDFAIERLKRFPNMHIYHYAPYEEAAVKRLMSVYGTREPEVDHLLRNRILVDLYKTVKEGIRVSEPRYSIKNLETFYMEKRDGEVKSGGQSIVVFDQWRQTRDPDKLKEIRDYNEIDCKSTFLLREWLLGLKPPLTAWFEPPKPDEDSSENIRQAEERQRQYEAKLLTGAGKGGELLYHLLEFHRREAKSAWWKLFDLREKSNEELIHEPEAIGGMTFVSKEPLPKPSRSFIHTYLFPEQDFKLSPGKACISGTGKFEEVEMVEIDEARRLVKIKCGPNKNLPPVLSLLPGRPVDGKILKEALYRLADSVIQDDGNYGAIKSFLKKEPPRVSGRSPGEPLVKTPTVAEIVEAAANLDHSFLFIQGPPGAGKTYTASHVIAELLRRKKRIGVSSNSHKAINNLLSRVEMAAVEAGVSFTGVKKAGEEEHFFEGRFIRSEKDPAKILGAEPDLIAGTAWLFARSEFDRKLDFLFVDEAGQVSLANLTAMALSTENFVLLGDQMQLAQPVQGIHPGASGLSALDYLLGEEAAISPDRGIFLETSWRMHEKVCTFISEAVYDGKLHPDFRNQNQKLILKAGAHPALKSAGIGFVAASHSNRGQSCREEGEMVRDLYLSLLEQSFQDKKGTVHPMTPEEILIVAPYNMQVNLLKAMLPENARVGTIDKFQGQEAQVVVISMTASGEGDPPRSMEFLYSKNRLNVAISRAKCLAIVVANPGLMSVKCETSEQIELVNTLCWVNEYALDHPPDRTSESTGEILQK